MKLLPFSIKAAQGGAKVASASGMVADHFAILPTMPPSQRLFAVFGGVSMFYDESGHALRSAGHPMDLRIVHEPREITGMLRMMRSIDDLLCDHPMFAFFPGMKPGEIMPMPPEGMTDVVQFKLRFEA
ncbi:MAG: hypothetical protein ACTHKB_11530 [Burkholderiaceae bacterium]